MIKNIDIYTDGACSGNPGVGAYSVIIVNKDKDTIIKKLGQKKDLTTNNEMELKAIYKALLYLNQKLNMDKSGFKTIYSIYSDSEYSVKGLNEWANKWKNNGWRKADNKIIKNQQLWSDIYDLFELLKININISVIYVKGHSGNKYNEIADKHAKEVMYAINNKNKNIQCKKSNECTRSN